MPTERDTDQRETARRQRHARNALLQLLRGFEVDDLRRIAFDLLDPDLVYDLPEGAISRNEVIYAILDWRERRMGPSSTDVDALLSKLDDDLDKQRTLLDEVARKWEIHLPSWGPAPEAARPDGAGSDTPRPTSDDPLFDFSGPDAMGGLPEADDPPGDVGAVAAFLKTYSRQAYDVDGIQRRSANGKHPHVAALSPEALSAALEELADRGDVREIPRPDGSTRYTWEDGT